MPASKKALLRYRLIDDALTDVKHPYPSLRYLLDTVNERLALEEEEYTVSERTLQKDLQDMRFSPDLGYMAPIEYHQANRGYYYSEEGYSIKKLPLKKEEREVLAFAAKLLGQYQEIPVFQSFGDITRRIFEVLDIQKSVGDDPKSGRYIQFEQAPEYDGSKWLGVLAEAIKAYKKVRIAYQKFDSEIADELLLHPYLLKQYRNRWYLVGNNELKREIRTFGLERIAAVELLDEPFPYEDFRPEEYFKYSYGIYSSTKEQAEKIVISCDKVQGSYLRTQPIHHSQRLIEQRDERLYFSLYLFPSEDFMIYLMGLADRIRVEEPASLNLALKKKLRAAADRQD